METIWNSLNESISIKFPIAQKSLQLRRNSLVTASHRPIFDRKWLQAVLSLSISEFQKLGTCRSLH